MHSNAEDGKKLKLLEIKSVSACTHVDRRNGFAPSGDHPMIGQLMEELSSMTTRPDTERA